MGVGVSQVLYSIYNQEPGLSWNVGGKLGHLGRLMGDGAKGIQPDSCEKIVANYEYGERRHEARPTLGACGQANRQPPKRLPPRLTRCDLAVPIQEAAAP